MMETIYILRNFELSPSYTTLRAIMPYSVEGLAALFSVTDVLASNLGPQVSNQIQ
jgi:hypothetical protein